MFDIRHRVGITAPARRVYHALHHCSAKWTYRLLALKAGLEGGAATPYPEDMKISGRGRPPWTRCSGRWPTPVGDCCSTA